jgi:DNA-binding beta-propeller fold protein YncE
MRSTAFRNLTRLGASSQVGQPGSGDGEFNFPASVAVDTSGNVYVADLFNTRIQSSTQRELPRQVGKQGVADGQFNQALGVAADASGNVYVADAVNHNVQKFDSMGTSLPSGAAWARETVSFCSFRVGGGRILQRLRR